MTGSMENLKYLHAPMGFHVGGVDARVQNLLKDKKWVLNVGAKRMGEPHWINMDIIPHSASVNLLGDAHVLPLADGSMDAVVMKFVLEHVPEPAKVVSEIFRVLKPGGVF
jgi:predicted SAM-dependent methyltransferase